MLNQPFFIPVMIILLLAFPLILEIIPPNRIYGIRTVETLADEQRWYKVNQYGGWAFLLSSLLYLFIAGLYPSVVAGETLFGRWIVHLLAFAVPLLFSIILIRNYLKR